MVLFVTIAGVIWLAVVTLLLGLVAVGELLEAHEQTHSVSPKRIEESDG